MIICCCLEDVELTCQCISWSIKTKILCVLQTRAYLAAARSTLQRLQARHPAADDQQLQSAASFPGKPQAHACSKNQHLHTARNCIYSQPVQNPANGSDQVAGQPADQDRSCRTARREQHLQSPIGLRAECMPPQPSAASLSGEGSAGQQMSTEQVKHQPDLNSDGLCAICLEFPTEIVFQPCLHAAACVSCARKIMSKAQECLICRSPLQSAVLLVGPVMQSSMYCP